MTTTIQRRLAALALGLFLALGTFASPVFAQPPAQAPAAKEPTDGFFDVPTREAAPSWGLPAYLLTATMSAGAIFIVCKSARRG